MAAQTNRTGELSAPQGMPENCGLHAGVLGPIETLARWKCIGRDLELLYKIGGGVKIEPELLDEYIRKGRRAPLPSSDPKPSG